MTPTSPWLGLLQENEQEKTLHLLTECFGENNRNAAVTDMDASFAKYAYVPISYVAKIGDDIIGFLQTVTSYFHPNTYSVAWFCVLPHFRQQGIGKKLLSFAESYILREKFQGKDGTMMLVAWNNKKLYYEKLGYQGNLLTHDGFPIMVKHLRVNTNG